MQIDFDAMPTLGDIPRYHARLRPGKPAMTFEGRTIAWQALDAGANRAAHALRAAGCAVGDRVAYVGKGTDEFFELMFGIAKSGAVIAPIQWRLAAPEIVQILSDAQPKLLFLGSEQLEKIEELCAGGYPREQIIAMEQGGAGLQRYQDWRDSHSDAEWRGEPNAQGGADARTVSGTAGSTDSLLAGLSRTQTRSFDVVDPHIAVDPGAVALQLYTSGTTGLPKGVMLSHRNILAGRREAVREQLAWNEWREDDVNLVALPVGHIGGVGWAIVGFLNGAHTIVQREFLPAQVLEAIERQQVSKMFLVPTALHMLLLQPRVREIDYSRMRHILYGASPIALDLLREATEVFGCGFCQQYGMTETCGTIVYLPPEDHDPAGNARMRAAGVPMPGVEIRVVDASSRAPLPAGQIGEVETRSIANMVGYWNRPDATAETVDAEGWLRTGDAGFLDEDGYLYIQDRFKDMICSGAENVYPAEVENAVYGHPAVQEVAVIGVPDEKWGEAVKAMVVLKPGAGRDAQDIIAFARKRLAGFKVPKSVEFVSALPRGPSGKVLRRVLREPYWAGRARRVN